MLSLASLWSERTYHLKKSFIAVTVTSRSKSDPFQTFGNRCQLLWPTMEKLDNLRSEIRLICTPLTLKVSLQALKVKTLQVRWKTIMTAMHRHESKSRSLQRLVRAHMRQVARSVTSQFGVQMVPSVVTRVEKTIPCSSFIRRWAKTSTSTLTRARTRTFSTRRAATLSRVTTAIQQLEKG